MAEVTAKDIGDIYARWGILNNPAVYAEVAAKQLGLPLTDILDKPQEERQAHYRDAKRLMDRHGAVEETGEGWTFALADPVAGGNGVTLDSLSVKHPGGRVIAQYGCPAPYRSGPPLLRWQIATCAELPIEIIEQLAVGDYLHIAEVVAIHANADFALIDS